jgi:hypothetical protein
MKNILKKGFFIILVIIISFFILQGYCEAKTTTEETISVIPTSVIRNKSSVSIHFLYKGKSFVAHPNHSLKPITNDLVIPIKTEIVDGNKGNIQLIGYWKGKNFIWNKIIFKNCKFSYKNGFTTIKTFK